MGRGWLGSHGGVGNTEEGSECIATRGRSKLSEQKRKMM